MLTALACAGCQAPPRSQALIALDTDAPVPRLMDRLLIEILDEHHALACPGCRRELALDDTTRWPLSLGVAAPDGAAARYLRARLFPAGRTSQGEPQPPTAVDAVAALSFPGGVAGERLLLTLDCAGVPAELAAGTSCGAPIAAAPPDDHSPSRAGSWHAELARGCGGPERADSGVYDGDACIAGGVFRMGDVRRQGFGGAFDAVPEHVVALSPFFLDRYEFTVGRWRAALAAGFRPLAMPTISDAQQCNAYAGAADAARDLLPLNCITRDGAAELCAREGKRLPTEAEWEWAGGSREQKWLYPWGNDPPACGEIADRVMGMCDHAGVGPSGGAVGTHPRDRSVDGIFDLTANVSEWLADDFAYYDDPCWQPGRYGVDPRCVSADATTTSVRGGFFHESGPYNFMVPSRRQAPWGASGSWIGFRCARDDR